MTRRDSLRKVSVIAGSSSKMGRSFRSIEPNLQRFVVDVEDAARFTMRWAGELIFLRWRIAGARVPCLVQYPSSSFRSAAVGNGSFFFVIASLPSSLTFWD